MSLKNCSFIFQFKGDNSAKLKNFCSSNSFKHTHDFNIHKNNAKVCPDLKHTETRKLALCFASIAGRATSRYSITSPLHATQNSHHKAMQLTSQTIIVLSLCLHAYAASSGEENPFIEYEKCIRHKVKVIQLNRGKAIPQAIISQLGDDVKVNCNAW